jgi:hypothetical protein
VARVARNLLGDTSNVGLIATNVTRELDNKKSVRGTIVLRWEYVRGSTLFMVWNLAPSDEEARKGLDTPWRDLRGAFGAPATNTFAIKLSYWLAP